jgi:hypothetical protein
LFVGFNGLVGIIAGTITLLFATGACSVAKFLAVMAIPRELAFTSRFSMSASYFIVTTSKTNLLLISVSSAARIGLLCPYFLQ